MSVSEIANLNIPVDNLNNIISDHSRIENQLQNTNKECGLLKNMMSTLLLKALSPVKADSKSSAISVSPSTSSVTSIQEISDDEVTVVEQPTPSHVSQDTSAVCLQ